MTAGTFDYYEVQVGVYDEAFEAPGEPRPHYVPLLDTLAGADLSARGQALKSRPRERGVRFCAAPGGLFAPAPGGLFPLSPVPPLITPPEGETIRAGVIQRARALERFAADVYGERAI